MNREQDPRQSLDWHLINWATRLVLQLALNSMMRRPLTRLIVPYWQRRNTRTWLRRTIGLTPRLIRVFWCAALRPTRICPYRRELSFGVDHRWYSRAFGLAPIRTRNTMTMTPRVIPLVAWLVHLTRFACSRSWARPSCVVVGYSAQLTCRRVGRATPYKRKGLASLTWRQLITCPRCQTLTNMDRMRQIIRPLASPPTNPRAALRGP